MICAIVAEGDGCAVGVRERLQPAAAVVAGGDAITTRVLDVINSAISAESGDASAWGAQLEHAAADACQRLAVARRGKVTAVAGVACEFLAGAGFTFNADQVASAQAEQPQLPGR